MIKIGLIKKIFGDYSAKEVKRIKPLCDKVLSYEELFSTYEDSALRNMTKEFKARLAEGETLDDILPEAYAVCREAAWRVLGMKHFPVQIIGGIILHQGRIAEMKTGEGKTLTETLPAYLNALTGNGVHIVTVNDYLAERDSDLMGKIFRFLGLTVGLIVNGIEPDERRRAYEADITYGTNNEMGFDYLRDNMATNKRDRVQRGHNFVIVDEVDSILIDEARTPLIISGKGEKPTDFYSEVNRFAVSLKPFVVKEVSAREDIEDLTGDDYDYIVNEKAKTATLTSAGVTKAESRFGVENLMDPDNMALLHYINQAIKAVGVMKRDINYIVKDGEVLIVDEFTGRVMPGRRYSDGLHQAIEAKEGIEIKNENKTLATVTFQNYFRLYTKLSGMTGTALTEKDEFSQIYSLDAIAIPTNKPVIRNDLPDVVYKTEQAKFDAIIQTVLECKEKNQPVLIGTASIDKSEKLSRLLNKRGIKHNILNAKNHEMEAEIIAQAGTPGSVTIATNMAGRGTDIKLGGNSEHLAVSKMRSLGYTDDEIADATGYADTDDERILKARDEFRSLVEAYEKDIAVKADEVRKAGGLYIIGTERHESRRIDNQLRGRAGRQGDPGTSKFFLSLEDDLMRLFGGSKITTIMNSLNTPDNMPIEAKALTNAIENAQKNIEGRNFALRKNVLQFDDVINVQRQLVYEQRNRVLDGEELKPLLLRMIDDSINDTVDMFCSPHTPTHEWDTSSLKSKFKKWGIMTDEDLSENSEIASETDAIKYSLYGRAEAIYNKREELFGLDENGESAMRELERLVLLRNIDRCWMEHIDAMDQLRKGIGLRSYGNSDPVVAYRNIGAEMFEDMNLDIKENTARLILTVTPKKKPENKQNLIKIGFTDNKKTE